MVKSTPLAPPVMMLDPTLTLDPSQFQLTLHPQTPLLILLCADTLCTLNHLLMRASIYVEHPKHRLKPISVDVFNQSKLTAYHGHNLRLEDLARYYACTPHLLPAEQPLRKWLVHKKWVHPSTYQCLTKEASRMYLLGWVRGQTLVVQHELHHAIYFLHAEYRANVACIWHALPNMAKRQVIAYLASCGYDASIHEDEFQAHLGNNEVMILAQDVILKDAKQKLEKIKESYMDWFDIAKEL